MIYVLLFVLILLLSVLSVCWFQGTTLRVFGRVFDIGGLIAYIGSVATLVSIFQAASTKKSDSEEKTVMNIFIDKVRIETQSDYHVQRKQKRTRVRRKRRRRRRKKTPPPRA